ncbi:acyltransferase domain-containing protein [Lacticaseibacillus parakribbianus]|uniref:acyltransferase domain-containing protein n=1 Tax=Lacticaseibacillus parakribbianus TaxID=2970927 RepID=UPI0021CB68D3|nr:acyltransferase domain-containing protein [Lacticaseibacillus parakribbianus]
MSGDRDQTARDVAARAAAAQNAPGQAAATQGPTARDAMTLTTLAAGIGLPQAVLEAATAALTVQLQGGSPLAAAGTRPDSAAATAAIAPTAPATAAAPTSATAPATAAAPTAATAASPEPVAPAQTPGVDWPAAYAQALAQTSDTAFHDWQAACLPLPDPSGLATLGLQLNLAVQANGRYRELGLSDAVYLASMGYFSRTVRESTAESGRAGFLVRDWSRRQLQLREFRLGSFEYERVGSTINLHIPGDADLTTPARLASYRAAQAFWREFAGLAVTQLDCESWLLAPVLDRVLKPQSHLRLFRGDFRLTGSDPAPEDYRKWLFDNDQGPAAGLATRTSLQRGVRDLVLHGEPIGIGFGVIDLTAILAN